MATIHFDRVVCFLHSCVQLAASRYPPPAPNLHSLSSPSIYFHTHASTNTITYISYTDAISNKYTPPTTNLYPLSFPSIHYHTHTSTNTIAYISYTDVIYVI
jgi:hypothetical protein